MTAEETAQDLSASLDQIEDGIRANEAPHLLATELEALREPVKAGALRDRLRFLVARATVENRQGAYKEALATLFEARQLAAAHVELADRRPEISRQFALVYSWRGHSEAASAELLRGFAEAVADPLETALLLAESGRASKEAGRFDAAIVQFAAALASPVLPPRERARAAIGRMQALNALSRYPECLVEAEACAAAVGTQDSRLKLLHRLECARAVAASGDVERAKTLLVEAREHLPSDPTSWSHVDWQDAESEIDLRSVQGFGKEALRARVAAMRENIRRTLEPVEEQRLFARLGAGRLLLSELARQAGEVEIAIDEASRALRVAHRERLPALVERARGALLACDHLSIGRADDAATVSILPERYLLCEPLGRGGYGEVRRAFSLETGEELALKTIDLGRVTDPERRALLTRDAHAELERARRVRHPGLVGIHSVFVDNAAIVLVQDFVRGRSLRKLIEARAPRREMLGLFVQIAHALGTLHGAGIAHRDMKPENVMVNTAGNAIIIDFGLASLAGEHSELAPPRGTARYAAPELWHPKDRQSQALFDVYALGVMLKEAVPDIPSKGIANLFGGGDPLARLARAMTSDDPSARPQSMQAIAGALESALASAAVAS